MAEVLVDYDYDEISSTGTGTDSDSDGSDNDVGGDDPHKTLPVRLNNFALHFNVQQNVQFKETKNETEQVVSNVRSALRLTRTDEITLTDVIQLFLPKTFMELMKRSMERAFPKNDSLSCADILKCFQVLYLCLIMRLYNNIYMYMCIIYLFVLYLYNRSYFGYTFISVHLLLSLKNLMSMPHQRITIIHFSKSL